MSGISSTIYNTIIRSNAVFISTVFIGAFGTQLAFDSASDKIWNNMNQGRQWKDIKHKYMEKDDEDDE